MAIAHMSRRDDHPRIFERETDLKELKQYLGSLKGRTIMTPEESGSAHWLYLELLDSVEKIIVCDPFHNRLLWHGPKTDKIDAGKLCELLRAGLLKEVYHSDNGLFELRTLVSAYQDVVTAGVRALNQKKALALGHRDKGKSASFLGEVLQENIGLYRRSKQQYERRLADVARRNTQVRYQREIDGIGATGAVRIVATVVDARRFPSTGKYFSCCGLVKYEKLSDGHSYGRRKPRYNRVLKSVYKTAALAAIRHANHTVAARFAGARAAPRGSERTLNIDGSSGLEGEFKKVNARLICFAEEADARILVNPLPCILEFAVARRELR